MPASRKLERAFAWIWDRLVVALVSAIVAAITLLAWSALLFILLGTPSDDFGVAEFIAAAVFSKMGVAIIAVAAFIGFCVGGDRMAEIFSALWGTHALWSRVGAYVQEKLEPLNFEYTVSTPILIGVVLLIAAVAWLYLA